MSARGRVLLTLCSSELTYLVGGPVIAVLTLGWLRLPLTDRADRAEPAEPAELAERMPAVAR